MKRIIYIIAAMAFAVTTSVSCSQEKEGAGDITIGFAQTEYRMKESAGLTKIKFDIQGEAKKYPVSFDVEAKVISDDGAQLSDIIHFTQTKGLRVAGLDLAPVFLEFMVKDNPEINESRFVELTITNVSGASLSQSTTVLEIRDNDNDPYDKLMGDWTASATDHNGNKVSFPVNISGGFNANDVQNNEGKVLVCWGFGPYQREYSNASPTRQPVWYMDFDEDASKVYVQPNSLMANVFQFSDIPYDVIIRCNAVEPGPKISVSHRLEGTWSKDMKTIKFEEGYGLTAAIYTTAGEYTGNVWMIYTDIVLTRK